MRYLIRTILITGLLFFCIGCDQTTKTLARTYLLNEPTMSFLNDVFRLQYIENTGAFLGIGNNFPPALRFWLLTVIVSAFLLAGIIYLFFNKKLTPKYIITYSFILGGGISNLFDRLINNGKVVDFLNVGIGNIRTGIFNVADMLIMFGTIFLIYLLHYDKANEA